MVANDPPTSQAPVQRRSPLHNIKFFVLCHSLLQLAQLLVSGYMKSSISTIERRYGLTSQKSGLLAAFNEVGNTVLIIFVSFFGSRIHRPRFIGGGALLACVASLLMALPHFLTGPYDYNWISSSSDNSSGLCQSERSVTSLSSNQNCSQPERSTQDGVYLVLLLGQLLLGIGAVPIQPFGISYIDDYASKKNSPLYLGILLAMTSIGPALGFVSGSFMLRFYVDFDKLPKEDIKLDSKDLRWVGAWWLGFLVAACLLFLTAIPYLFFPREMPKEFNAEEVEASPDSEQQQQPQSGQEVSLLQFLKSFPQIILRVLRSPIYLLVVLAQVNLAALLSGLATFMAKFIERQFDRSISFSTMMIGSFGIPMAVLGTVLGGAMMRRANLSVSGASKLCTVAILLCMCSALPMLFIGCSTQNVSGVFSRSASNVSSCSPGCPCSEEAFNPVCGSDGMEFKSPCHAGCITMETNTDNKVTNYTKCRCVGGLGYASPGTCGSGCSHLLRPFLSLMAITAFVAAFSQTPSCMMILRTVAAEDKSFAVGIQYMMFRVLAFMPGPVLYGSVIDTTCILWGRKCGKQTSCNYYNLDQFRQRFLGLMTIFVSGALLCFVLSMVVLRRRAGLEEPQKNEKAQYELVEAQEAAGKVSCIEKQVMEMKT